MGSVHSCQCNKETDCNNIDLDTDKNKPITNLNELIEYNNKENKNILPPLSQSNDNVFILNVEPDENENYIDDEGSSVVSNSVSASVSDFKSRSNKPSEGVHIKKNSEEIKMEIYDDNNLGNLNLIINTYTTAVKGGVTAAPSKKFSHVHNHNLALVQCNKPPLEIINENSDMSKDSNEVLSSYKVKKSGGFNNLFNKEFPVLEFIPENNNNDGSGSQVNNLTDKADEIIYSENNNNFINSINTQPMTNLNIQIYQEEVEKIKKSHTNLKNSSNKLDTITFAKSDRINNFSNSNKNLMKNNNQSSSNFQCVTSDCDNANLKLKNKQNQIITSIIPEHKLLNSAEGIFFMLIITLR